MFTYIFKNRFRLIISPSQHKLQSVLFPISALSFPKVRTKTLLRSSEENHVIVRERLKAYSIIPPRNMHVPVWKTHGRYRKQMKRGYTKLLYNQRNKDETIMSVIKRLFGEYVTSKLIRTAE